MKSLLILVALLAGCALPEPPKAQGELRIKAYACDGAGVVAVVIESTGVGTATVHWDNKDACGTSV